MFGESFRSSLYPAELLEAETWTAQAAAFCTQTWKRNICLFAMRVWEKMTSGSN
jgi:hypothetical protein